MTTSKVAQKIGVARIGPCPDCGAEMILRDSQFGLFYGCERFPACRATHGAHDATGEPLGVPADAETKQARIDAHEIFDQLWSNGRERKAAYAWLAGKLGIPYSECHFGSFDKETCERAAEICAEGEDDFARFLERR